MSAREDYDLLVAVKDSPLERHGEDYVTLPQPVRELVKLFTDDLEEWGREIMEDKGTTIIPTCALIASLRVALTSWSAGAPIQYMYDNGWGPKHGMANLAVRSLFDIVQTYLLDDFLTGERREPFFRALVYVTAQALRIYGAQDEDGVQEAVGLPADPYGIYAEFLNKIEEPTDEEDAL